MQSSMAAYVIIYLTINSCIRCLSDMNCGYIYIDEGRIFPLNQCIYSASDIDTQNSTKLICNTRNNAVIAYHYENTQCSGNPTLSETISDSNDKFDCYSNVDCNTATLTVRNYSKCTNGQFYGYRTYTLTVNDECFTVNDSYSVYQSCSESGILFSTYSDSQCSNLISTSNMYDGQCITLHDPDFGTNSYEKYEMNECSAAGSSFISTSPTVSSSASPVIERESKYSLFSSDDVNEPLLYAAIGFTCIGVLVSISLLIYFRPMMQNDSSRGTWKQTWKAMSVMDKLFVVLKIADVGTDFMFAVDLLLEYDNEIIKIFGWVAFLTMIIGFILFVVKLVLMRKILYKIPQIKEQRSSYNLLNKEQKVKETTQEIRDRNNLLLFVDLLAVSLEDCPQTTISFLILIGTGGESVIELINLAVSLVTLFWCPVSIFLSCCGCCDDPLDTNHQGNHTNSNQGNIYQDEGQEQVQMIPNKSDIKHCNKSENRVKKINRKPDPNSKQTQVTNKKSSDVTYVYNNYNICMLIMYGYIHDIEKQMRENNHQNNRIPEELIQQCLTFY
eukprot:159045_1